MAVNATKSKDWNRNTSKDTFANMAILIAGLLIVIAGAVDLPLEAAQQVIHVADQQTTVAR